MKIFLRVFFSRNSMVQDFCHDVWTRLFNPHNPTICVKEKPSHDARKGTKQILTVVGRGWIVGPPHLCDEERRPTQDVGDDDHKCQFDRLQLGPGEAHSVGPGNHAVPLRTQVHQVLRGTRRRLRVWVRGNDRDGSGSIELVDDSAVRRR